MNFSFGTDPEFIIQKNNKICSAINVLKGDKDNKTKIEQFEFYYDNVLAECTIPPSFSKEETLNNIKNCLKNFSTLINPCELLIKASHKYPRNELLHEDALKVYCVPENCCYLMDEIGNDEEIFHKTNLRSAGGHIHLGNPLLKKGYNSWMVPRLLDLFLGIPSVYLDDTVESKKRKEIYGKAGRFRFTEYGIEYRSLSNFWLASPKLVELIYEICDFVLKSIENDSWKELWFIDEVKLNNQNSWKDPKFDSAACHVPKYNLNALKKAINSGDKNLANEFMTYIQKYLPKNIFEKIIELSNQKFDFKEEWDLRSC